MKTPRRIGAALGVVAAGVAWLGFAGCSSSDVTAPAIAAAPSAASPAPMAASMAGGATASPAAPGLGVAIPLAVAGGRDQVDFDVLSWNTFVALNWPVLPSGQPNPAQSPGQTGDNRTLWETWKESYEVFLPNGAPPSPWGVSSPLAAGAEKALVQLSKKLEDSTQPFQSGPLIDQNGRYARFEILMNRPTFDYIVAHTLYSKAGQQNATGIVFPCSDPKTSTLGSIIVKAAWKILSADEKKSGRFHMSEALIYSPPQIAGQPITGPPERATVGLVGLHIVHKTLDSPQWVWSTFEQIDNCPTRGEVASLPRYNFFNKDAFGVKENTPPPRPWDPSRPGPPAQIVREIPIDATASQVNATYQAALRRINPNSVWQYYQLVSTQWPTEPAPTCNVLTSAPVNRLGSPTPLFLANATLESYIQGRTPNGSSSCLECHARGATTAGAFADFTFLLERAR